MNLLDNSDHTVDDDAEDKDYVAELAAKGRSTAPNDLAKANVHATRHISVLEAELKALREEREAGLKMKDFLDRMETLRSPGTNQDTPIPDQTQVNQSAKIEDIDKLLDAKFQQKSEQQRQEANIKAAKARLREAFGDEFPTRLKQDAESLGVSVDWLNEIAATNPNALFRILGVDSGTPRTAQAPVRGTVSLGGGSGSNQKNQKFYDNLFRTNPSEYWARQEEMHAEALKQGVSFFN